MSIVEPLKYISYKSKAKTNTTIITVWIISSLWFIPINFWQKLSSESNHDAQKLSTNYSQFTNLSLSNSNHTKPNENYIQTFECHTQFETNKSFKILTTFVNFYVPLLGMILIYSRIFWSIKCRSGSELLNTNNKMKSNKSVNSLASPTDISDFEPVLKLNENDSMLLTKPKFTHSKTFDEELPLKTNQKSLRGHKVNKYASYRSRRNGLNQSSIIETLPDSNNCKSKRGNFSCQYSVNSNSFAERKRNNTQKNLVQKMFSGSHEGPRSFRDISPGLKQQIKAAKQLGILSLNS